MQDAKSPYRSAAAAAGITAAALAVALCCFAGGLAAQAPGGGVNAGAGVEPALLGVVQYRYIGPDYGGRVTAVAGHPAHPRTFYFGGTGGGVFRTDDAGQNWRNITDGQLPVGSIGAIKVAPTDPSIIYVGTGSAAIRSNVSIGKGMFKSVDQGATWSFAGLEKAGVIADMVVHPTNPDIVFVAAVGNPFGPNPERGVYRTRDGGNTWQRVLFVSDSTGASDVALNPRNPNELYAGMWRAERKPWTIISGARGEGGLYKSDDGGDSWRKLTNGLPQEFVGKIAVTVSPTNPRRVYALIEAGDGTLGRAGGERGGVYRSDDAGESWTLISQQAGLLDRPFYYTYIDVDPQDPDVVYVNNVSFFKSTDGGHNWQRMSTPHGDNHGMWINPDNPQIFIQSNDGGANVTLDGGRTWSPQTNQPTAELYQVDLDDRWPYWVYAGQQDRSTIGVPSTGATSRADWRTGIGGCETGPAVPQPGTDAQIFFSACKGRLYRYSAISGQTLEYAIGAANMYGHNPRDLNYRLQRVSPIVVSPHDPNVVYHGSQFLHRTEDGGRTWVTISPDLTANDPRGHVISGSPITRDITGEEIYSTLYAVAVSPLERGVIWTGANDGPIHVTRDEGRNWTNVTPPSLPGGGRVQTLEASPHRRGSAYIAVLRYMFDDWKPYIYRTDDYGANWTLLTGPGSGFPQDHPTRVVREDPDRAGLLYAGTEFGMFISFDNGQSWQSFQLNLPATPVTDLKVYRKDIVLSTQGRGFWIVDNVTPLHSIDRVIAGQPHLFTPREAYRGFRANEAVIQYYLPAATPALTLEILDAGGQVVSSFSGAAPAGGQQPARAAARLPGEAGMNSFSWNLVRDSAPGAGRAVVPGRYTVRLRVGAGQPLSVPLDVRVHPRLAADGVTAEDLQAQFELVVKVQALAADGRQLQQDIRVARQRFEQANNVAALSRLDALDRQVNNVSGQAYAQPMLLSQISYLSSIVSRGDARPNNHAFQRYETLRRELDALTAELARIR